jgi:hypothetical protein
MKKNANQQKAEPLISEYDHLYAEIAIGKIRDLKVKFSVNEDTYRQLHGIEKYLMRTMRECNFGQAKNTFQEQKLITGKENEELIDLGYLPYPNETLNEYLKHLA